MYSLLLLLAASSNKMKSEASHFSKHIVGSYCVAGTALGFVRDTKISGIFPFPPWYDSPKLAVIPEKVNYVFPVLESIVR